jgi:hypothetical protein
LVLVIATLKNAFKPLLNVDTFMNLENYIGKGCMAAMPTMQTSAIKIKIAPFYGTLK